MILLIDNYDSFTYNLYQYLSELNAEVQVRRNDSISAAKALALKPSAVVISPGPARPPAAGISKKIIELAPPSLPIWACVWVIRRLAKCLAQSVGGGDADARQNFAD